MISLRNIFLTFFDHVLSCSGFNKNGAKVLVYDLISLMVTDDCAADIVFSGEKPAQDWV